jgi:hypothetical protein
MLSGNGLFSQNKALNSPFGREMGWGMAMTVSDFNGDGLADIAVLAPDYQNTNKMWLGAATVYYGSSKGFSENPNQIIVPKFIGHTQGIGSCTSADFNNDGFDELVVSNPFYGEPQLDRGFVQVFWGSAEGINAERTTVKTGNTAYGSFGSNVACLDFNGDSIDDLLVEARFDQILEGRIYIYYGGKNFSLETPDIALKVDNSQSLYFCFSDDLNGDGVADIICRSNSNWNATTTQMYFFHGGTNPKNTHVQYHELENFTPLFYCKTESVVFGVSRDNNHSLSTEALKITHSGFQQLNIKTEGIPFKISEDKIMLIRNSGNPMLHIYTFRNNEFKFLQKMKDLPETTAIRYPKLFSPEKTAPIKLIVPILSANREKLVFINLEK